MTTLREKTAITGVGETKYSRNSGTTALALQLEASLNAIADAGLSPKDIDGVIPYGAGAAVAEDFITNFGIEDLRYSATTPMGGASCVAALQSAAMAVASGVAKHVLIPIGRNGASQGRVGDRVREMPQFRVIGEYEMPVGSIAPAQLYAQMARRHMELYGTRSEQLAEIAITVRNHAILNDNALMQKPLTVEDHQASRIISDPLRLFDCCLESDGGAAVVVSSAERARDQRQKPVFLMGGCRRAPGLTERHHPTRRPHPLGDRQSGPQSLRNGRRDPPRYRRSRNLRLFHLHRDVPARRSWVLPQRRGRQLCRRRAPRPGR